MTILYIAAGGVLGTLARYVLAVWVHAWMGTAFPWGILVVNASGALGLGFLFPFMLAGDASPELRAGVAIGFFGAFTTMSTFGFETLALAQDGQWARAAAYVAATLVLVVAGTALGIAAAALLTRTGG